ncbi:MAG: UDP-N-acetylglucosamine--N-acetylmuramyl-(pentapeptide) pyrophosphoryl-undecaprenol N-acetylglucosamine transferase [Rickettsiales bacterium]|jgi:UDP-N-acetylglucosamine--N-acetylmuramyl-(pentapeptide) pyrophosphoryl-undecaprenol N-acetylglucosamine transferase|nr:UDP-N-acetylglucosamine--N-acetylmuramyl-(pentapeptide) pyrophosphoryl-undecaprenol N-acetylglucosamine transferase [Rickettsiales bacterium]
MKIWIATGGTGGHIFPALAVAQSIVNSPLAGEDGQRNHAGRHDFPSEQNPRIFNSVDSLSAAAQPPVGGQNKITISTDARGYDMVARNKPANAKVARVWASGVGNRSPIGKIVALSKIALSAAALSARFLVSRPSRIVAFGGYSSVPAVLAGKLLRIPVFLHEQNAAAGRANALSAKFADKILISFPGTTGLPKNARIELTGLPVRSDFRPAPYNAGHAIFITGGSLGANILREVVPAAIEMLPPSIRNNLSIVQQVDNNSIQSLSKFYTNLNIKHRLAPFFKDMATEISEASLVIGRSGAGTVAELMTVGRPAILVPLNINPDQLANARAFEKLGGGITIEQKNFTPKYLSSILSDLFSNPARLEKMAASAQTPNHATENILRAIL